MVYISSINIITMYFVYTHTRLDTNEIFYVGLGKIPPVHRVFLHNTKYARAYERSKRSDFWKNIYNKTKYKVDIVFESENKIAVENKEIELIKFYGRRCCDDNGILVNFAEGGMHYSGTKSRGIKIIQKDLNNNVIKIWDELKDIQNNLGYLKTNIVKCCRKKQITAYGYKWEYLLNKEFQNKIPTSSRKDYQTLRCGISIINNISKEIINFQNQEEVAKYLNIHRSTVQKHMNKIYKNYFFVYKKCPQIINKELGFSKSRLDK